MEKVSRSLTGTGKNGLRDRLVLAECAMCIYWGLVQRKPAFLSFRTRDLNL